MYPLRCRALSSVMCVLSSIFVTSSVVHTFFVLVYSPRSIVLPSVFCARFGRQLQKQNRSCKKNSYKKSIINNTNKSSTTSTPTQIQVPTQACEGGCLAFLCRACALIPSKHESDDDANSSSCCCSCCCFKHGVAQRRKRVYTPVWSSPTDLSEIRVTPAFLVDHSPDEILKVVKETIKDLGVST